MIFLYYILSNMFWKPLLTESLNVGNGNKLGKEQTRTAVPRFSNDIESV